jgi:hypothetical protein
MFPLSVNAQAWDIFDIYTDTGIGWAIDQTTIKTETVGGYVVSRAWFLKRQLKNTKNSKEVFESKLLIGFQCKEDKIKDLAVHEYNSKKEVLRSTTENHYGYEDTIPGSFGKLLQNMVCDKEFRDTRIKLVASIHGKKAEGN